MARVTSGRPLRRTSPPTKPSSAISKKSLRTTQERHPQVSSPHPQKRHEYNLASRQRDIFDWYERCHYNDDAGNIYSPEWQYRLKNWEEEFGQDIESLYHEIASCERMPHQLEIGMLFQVHPIAAFSLWNLLQACYALDKVICGSSTPESDKLQEWQSWRPLQYLLSEDVTATWVDSLAAFSSKIKLSTSKFDKEAEAIRLYEMAEGFQSLEEARKTLVSVFQGNRDNMSCSYWTLNLILTGVNKRCRVIEDNYSSNC
ncbi:hypothetical protein BP5796_13253 [Coleophoma crateriformis]|uniref:Uncharacterized protein n=1 Tax=Coleophoma crateriformis TaxID=565419 RepID=A0A3D8Q2K7_9HELO|nr:hypothetical protein BP5796_13253 [Coleophoma crateriformis]